MNATPLETEAVRLRHRHLNPDGPAEPSPEEFEVLLNDVRERTRAIEREAMGILYQHMNERRRTPRRHQRVAFALFVSLIVAAAILLAILR